MFEVVADDARIAPLLKNMNKQFIGNDFSSKSQSIDQLTPEKVDMAADTNMPLCMKVSKLKTDSNVFSSYI